MKLLHVTATHLKPEGGVPVVLKNLVTEQNAIPSFEAKVVSVVATVDGMQSNYFEYVKLQNFENYINKYNPDVVILHSFFYIQYNCIVSILYKKHIKYYIQPHGSFGKAALEKSKWKKLIANNTIFRKQITRAYGYIFLNEAEKEDSRYRSLNDVIIPNGIITDNISNDIHNSEKIKFYYIGRYDINHKGLDYLFSALDILDLRKEKFSFEFWGNGEGKNIDFMKQKAQKYQYINVKINNAIYGETKNLLLEQIGPMILTSRYEGFPMTILEAWGYGNPCLVTSGTNMAEETYDHKIGWKVELDAEAIANGIEKAYKEYFFNRDYYIRNCKEFVKKHYSWKNIAEQSYMCLKNQSNI